METMERSRVEPTGAPEVTVETACTAELAECTCPDFCERDHANE